jgi:uncharacterized cupredoxin-like copper-binding protein
MKRLAILLLALALAACGRQTGSGVSQAMIGVTLNAGDFTFTPAQIEVAAGQTIQVTLQNTGTQDHDFTIQTIPLADKARSSGTAANHMHSATNSAVHVAIKAGTTGSIEFTPTVAGVYEFDCTVAGHKAAGMVGQLTVTAP